MSVSDLLEQLSSLERWTRYQAKRLLFYRPSAKVIRETDAWLAKRWDVADDKWLEVIGVYEAHEAVRPSCSTGCWPRRITAFAPMPRAWPASGARALGPSRWPDSGSGPLTNIRASDWRRRWRRRMCPGPSRSRSSCRRGPESGIVFSITPLARARGRCSRIGIMPCATENWILPATQITRIFCESYAARRRNGHRRGRGSTTWPAWPVINRRGKVCPGCTRRWSTASG